MNQAWANVIAHHIHPEAQTGACYEHFLARLELIDEAEAHSSVGYV